MGKTKSAKSKVAKKTAKASPKRKTSVKATAQTKLKAKTQSATPKTKSKTDSKGKKTQAVTTKTTSKVVKGKATTKAVKKASVAPMAKAPTESVTAPKVSSKTQTPKLDQIKLQPLQNRILVELVTAEKTTPGGLIIPDTAQVSGNFKGTVLAVGTGIFSKKGKHRPMELKPGDKVLFAEWSGDKIEMNGKTLHILRESDVLGLVD